MDEETPNADDWAEVFALAEGDHQASLPSWTKSSSKDLLTRSSLNEDFYSKKNEPEEPRVEPYLPPILPDQEPFYELQGQLNHTSDESPSCKGYTRRTNEGVNTCQVCGRPSGYHQLITKNPPRASSSSDHHENSLMKSKLYVALRNLRCSLRANPQDMPPPGITKAFRDQVHYLLTVEKADIKKTSLKKRKRKRQQYVTSIAADPKLMDACRALTNETLSSFPTSKEDTSSRSKDAKITWAIKAIIACDAMYYRLYYADLTSGGRLVVPHPVQYFGCCDTDEKQNVSGSGSGDDDGLENSTRRQQIQQIFGYRQFSLGNQGSDNKAATHALERLHQLRMNEGRCLFAQFVSAQDEGLWRAWQDSCRDFLCHLYSYATLPTYSVQQLKKRLEAHSTIEIGAGTGYLARLLGNINAFDCHPGTADNEYHAATPPFMTVKTGGPKSIEQQHSALILCYPPVDNEMAHEALQWFLSPKRVANKTASSTTPLLVHIGEFQGLTGTPRFESLLLEKLGCVGRLPCFSWGSDAAEITMWEPRSNFGVVPSAQPIPSTSSLLVPCVSCYERQATRRFRLIRPFAYCSIECAELDKSILRDVLPSCFSVGLISWTSATDAAWQNLRVCPRLEAVNIRE